MKMNEKKTEELMTSLSPRFISEFADPAVIERKSHPEWAIILFLVLSLSVIGVVVGGPKANAGNTVPTEKAVIPKGTTPLEIKDYTILPGYEITRLYVMGVKTDHPEYQKACQAIRDAADSTDEMNEELKINTPNYYREVDLELGVPMFHFAVKSYSEQNKEPELYFVFPVIRNGRLAALIYAMRYYHEGEEYYSLGINEAEISLREQEHYLLNTKDNYQYEALSGFSSAETPLYVIGIGRICASKHDTSNAEGYAVIGNTLYRLGETFSETDGYFENLATGLNKAFLKDMGFEPEIKVWPIGK